jgi:hypothetical protein
MKTLLLLFLAVFPVAAQTTPQSPPAPIPGNVYTVSQYGQWLLYVYQGNTATGATSLFLSPYNASGQNIPVLRVGLPLAFERGTARAETVNVTGLNICNSGTNNCVTSQTCNPGSQICQVFGSFAFLHSQLALVQSGTFGLQETINYGMSQLNGTALIDQTWGGQTAMITAASGSTAVAIQDNRSGTPVNYQWQSTQYVQVSSGGGSGVSSITATTPIVASAPTGPVTISCPTCGSSGVSSLNGQTGAQSILAGSNVTVTPNGSNGVTVSATPGSSGVSSLNTQTGPQTIVGGSNVTVTPNGTNQVTIAFTGGAAGAGNVNSGPQYAISGYPNAGSNATVGPQGHLYMLSPSMTSAQTTTFLSTLTAGQDFVLIPPGYPQQGFANGSNVGMMDFRQAAALTQMAQGGVACDAQQFVGSITSGSNQINVGSNFGAEAIGKTLSFGVETGYGLNAPQYTWTPTITGYTFPNATLSSNAPFSYTGRYYYGTLNTANLQTLLNNNGAAIPTLLPSGCKVLTGTLAWNNGQSIIAMQNSGSGLVGLEALDILRQPDDGNHGAGVVGLRVENVGFSVGSLVDATLGYTSYDASGTPTTVPPMNRPVGQLTEAANNPGGTGWAQGGAYNGVASITQNSTLICVPNAVGRVPTVGHQLVFPNTPGVFKTVVASLSGSCAAGNTAVTVSPTVPNVAGYTLTQTVWWDTTSVQTTAAALPNGAITYPYTLTLTNSITPDSTSESNFAPHGRIKIGTQEFDYLGETLSPATIVLRRGPATTLGQASGSPVVPMNPCPASYETPWPVTPTINSGDSTPSQAAYFPANCVGNAAMAFPQANGNANAGTGLVGAFLTHLNFAPTTLNGIGVPFPTHTASLYQAGNTASYDVKIDGFNSNGLAYGIVQGPASIGQHGVALQLGTAAGNQYHNLTIRGEFPLWFDNMQQSELNKADTYSTEISPYDGTAIGGSLCVLYNYTLDEQTGGVASNTSQDTLFNWNCEPEGGTHAELTASAELDGSSMKYQQDNFEGGGNFIGGSEQRFEGGQLSNPVINYGFENDFAGTLGTAQGLITNSWGDAFVDWGRFTSCGSWAGGGNGPITHCTWGLAQPYSGHSMDAAITGNTAKPYENPLSSEIHPGEWNLNGAIDVSPMQANNVQDATEPYWHKYASCNLGASRQCRIGGWDGFNGSIFIGPGNRVVDGPTVLEANFKSAAAPGQMTLYVAGFDSGNGKCSSAGIIGNYTIATTTAWTHQSIPVDFTGKAGCALTVQFYNATTTDQYRVGEFSFVNVPGRVLTPTVSTAPTGSCGPNAILGSDANNLYLCTGGVVKPMSIAGAGGATPTGSAGGSLAGTYPNPGLAALTGTTAPALFGSLTGCSTAGYVFSPQSGSCIPGGSAAFPGTPGFVFNTSTTAARNATSSDLTTLLGYTPASIPANLGFALLGTATAGTVGTTKIFFADAFPSSCTVNAVAYTTQGDCAFYTAQFYGTTNSVSPMLIFGAGTYTTAKSFIMATGNFVPKIYGSGQQSTILQYTGASHIPVISRAAGSSAFLDIHNMTIDGNYNATAEIDILNLNQSYFSDMTLINNYPNTSYFMRVASGFQVNVERVQAFENSGSGLGNFNSATTYGYVTCTPSSGTIATAQCTLTSAGSGYPSGYATPSIIWNGNQNGTSYRPCSGTQPVGTGTVSGGIVTGFSVTTNGTTCTGTAYGILVAQFPVTYGFDFQVSDSSFRDLTSYVGKTAGFWTPTNNDFLYHLHPAFVSTGILNAGASTFQATELDSIFQYGMDLQGPNCAGGTACAATIGSFSNFIGAKNFAGMSSFYLESSANNTNFAGLGSLCGGTPPTGYTEFATSTGTIDSGTASFPANTSLIGNDLTCGSTVGDYIPILKNGTINGTAIPLSATLFTLGGSNQTVTQTPTFGNSFNFGLTNSANAFQGGQSRSGANQGVYLFLPYNATAATSGQNYNSPAIGEQSNYWNGSASINTEIQQQMQFGTGANPTQTYQFNMFGTPSSGLKQYAFDYQVAAPSFQSTDTVNNAAVTFGTGSGGDSSCPAALAGTSYLCTKSAGISASINGGPYVPIGGGGSTFTVTGCGTATARVGGSLAGKFVGGSSTCSPVITTGVTAQNGYACSIQDQTTSTAVFRQTAFTTTTVTFTGSGTIGATDTLVFGCSTF